MAIIKLKAPWGQEYLTSDRAEADALIRTRGYKEQKARPAPSNKARTPVNKAGAPADPATTEQ